MRRHYFPLLDTRSWLWAAAITAMAALAGCSTEIATEQLTSNVLPPVDNPITETNQSLRDLPAPWQPVVVAVYSYTDQTGQFKPNESAQTLSRAVTQGATSILIKALQDVGKGEWFTVVERERIDNLLKERAIVTQMRMTYLGEKRINPKALPPLLYAGIIFEGGVIGYDSNIQTGGVGARLLGIGGDAKYQLDTITIYLRAISTKSGQVLASVTTHKTIASIGLQGGVFKYIAFDKLLEAEAGLTKNEPEQIAVQQAIEKAVYSMVIEGAAKNVWAFADRFEQERLIRSYRQSIDAPGERDDDVVGSITPAAPRTLPAEPVSMAKTPPTDLAPAAVTTDMARSETPAPAPSAPAPFPMTRKDEADAAMLVSGGTISSEDPPIPSAWQQEPTTKQQSEPHERAYELPPAGNSDVTNLNEDLTSAIGR
jgi:curli production assembly/transport component CsgG